MELATTDYNAPEWMTQDQFGTFMGTAYNVVRQSDENGERVFFLREDKAYAYGYSTLHGLWRWVDPETVLTRPETEAAPEQPVEDETFSRTRDVLTELAILDRYADWQKNHERVHKLRTELAKLERDAARKSPTPVTVYVDVTAEGNVIITGPGFSGRATREGRGWRIEDVDTETPVFTRARSLPETGRLLAKFHGITNVTVSKHVEK